LGIRVPLPFIISSSVIRTKKKEENHQNCAIIFLRWLITRFLQYRTW
jgi:hypothetical protein